MDRDAHPDRLRFDLCVVLFLTHDQGIFARIEVRVLDAVVGIVDPFVVEAFQHVFVSRLFQRIDIVVRVERDDEVVLIVVQLYFLCIRQSIGENP